MGAEAEPAIELLAQEWESIAVLCSELDSTEWELPTECPGWSVRDVLSHLIGTERSLLGDPAPGPPIEGPPHIRNQMGAANEAWVVPRRPLAGREVLHEFVDVTSKRLAAMRSWGADRFDERVPSPVGMVPYREFMQVRVMDCWVHEQDIRVATHSPGHEGGPVAKLAIDRLASAMGFVVGKQAAAPEGASVRFEVTGDVPLKLDIVVRNGRAQSVDDLDSQPNACLQIEQEGFWRLACGRVTGEKAVSEGLAHITGDQEFGGRVVRSMSFMI